MQRQPFGQTGLQVTPLGLGMAALGRPGYINLGHADDLGQRYDPGDMEAHAHAVLDVAYAAGIRYFDAARSYGEGERFLASWLTAGNVSPDQVVIGSKWGYTYTADWRVDADKHEVKEHTLPVLRRQAEESRLLLGPWLKLYQIHSATLDSGVLDNPEVLEELGKLRDQGWKIGLSITGPRQADTLRKAMAIQVDGGPLFDAVQATWNLLERSCGPALAEAHAAGLGVTVKEALANGRLTDRNADPAFSAKRELLQKVARSCGCSIDALALAAVLAQPWVDVVLSGAATVAHLRANLASLDVTWTPEMEDLLASLVEPADEYWQTRAKLAWN